MDTETWGVEDPEGSQEPVGSKDLARIEDRFKTDPGIQAIYSDFSEELDRLLLDAREKYEDDLDNFESFVSRLSDALRRVEETGVEVIDVIERFQTEI